MKTLTFNSKDLGIIIKAMGCLYDEYGMTQEESNLMDVIQSALLEPEEDEPNAFLDAYYKAKEHLEVMRDQPEAKEFVQAMDDIMGHAMDMYISDAEDLGCEIVQNAEVIEERSYFRGKADQLHEDIRALSDSGMNDAVGILQDLDENSGNLCYI